MAHDQLIKVLVVEGDSEVRSRVRFSFAACGDFDLKFCAYDPEALQPVGDFCPDVVILDASLPAQCARMVLLNLRMCPKIKDVPIIFATGGCLEKELKTLLDLGVSDVVNRPFDPFAMPGQVLKTWQRAYA